MLLLPAGLHINVQRIKVSTHDYLKVEDIALVVVLAYKDEEAYLCS